MALYIIDLDGTIADDRARKIAAGPEPSRDDKLAYLHWLHDIQNEQTLAADAPIDGMATLLRGLAREQAIIVYLTAREEKYRDVTKQWLRKHNFPTAHVLLMRPNGSWASSRDLKAGCINEIKLTYPNFPMIAIDDDGSGDCAALYRDLNIPHLHMRLAPLEIPLISSVTSDIPVNQRTQPLADGESNE